MSVHADTNTYTHVQLRFTLFSSTKIHRNGFFFTEPKSSSPVQILAHKLQIFSKRNAKGNGFLIRFIKCLNLVGREVFPV